MINYYFLLLNITLLPITIYYLFYDFKNLYSSNIKNNIINLILFFILIIYIYFSKTLEDNKYIIFSLYILLTILFNKKALFVLSYLYIYEFYNINIYLLIISFILYFILYLYYNFNKPNINKFNILYSVITYIFYFNKINLFIIINIISIFILSLYINKLRETIKHYKLLEEIEKDKKYKTSIFKVTHEIKNPLAVIKGYLSIFDLDDIDKSKRYISILDKEVDNALLVLKDFSSINHLIIEKNNMLFNDLLLDVKETITPLLNNKSIKCDINIENNLNICADYNRLKQVFINLIKNSIEALDNRGSINIKAYKNNTNLIVTIKDNGCGMDKDTINNLFTPFYSKKSFGNGLGLCLSKEIIDKHGGSIKYTSVIHEYTQVKIVIPV